MTIQNRLAANLSLLFTEIPFLDRFAAAAEAGFEAVEIQFPYAFNADEIRVRLDDTGLKLALHNFPAGDWLQGERGLAIQPDGMNRFRDSVDQAIDYATALNCRQLNCLSGIGPEGATFTELEDVFVENLRYAADRLALNGLTLMIEPINIHDIPGFFLNRMKQALDILEKVDRDNLRIQYDAYHMHIMDEDICSDVYQHRDLIGHIQIADHPGRHEPGTGEIDFSAFFDQLETTGFKGFVGCEYQPLSSTKAGLTWRNVFW